MARKSKAIARKDGRPTERSAIVSWWLGEIETSKKREQDFRKDGKRVIEIYSGRKKEPFNILYSNTETLLPSLYSQTPRPVVTRRFKDDDPAGKAAAMAAQRMLEFLTDTNIEGYETFSDASQAAVLDALLPGRGVTCVKYDAKFADEQKTTELVCTDSTSWDRVYFGYARKWDKVPWIAFENFIDREEATRLFGDKAELLKYSANESDESSDRENYSDDEGGARDGDDKHVGDRRVVLVYQIWDKAGGSDGPRKIRYISPAYNDGYLKVEDDPLGLTGFYNIPKPLQFLTKPHDLIPVAPYVLYENQAKEINRLTLRINRIVEAIKARGLYDGSLGSDIANLLEVDDNALVAAEAGSSLAAEKGFANAIWMWPIEQLIAVLTQLYMAREQAKRVVYEVTGISDIVRGSSKASETLGAQEIKERWGTLRLRRLQRDVQRYSRDLLRLMLELAASKFSEETWARATGLPFVTTLERQQIEMVAAQAQAAGAQLPQELQAALAKPQWGQILQILQDDLQRSYKIDIETNSTIEPEAAEDQKHITELMAALGQYLNGVAPLVANGVMPFGAAKSMLLAISRRFQFGVEIEDEIKAMQPPKPQDDGKAQQQQAQMLAKDAEAAKADITAKGQIAQLQMQLQTEQQQSKLADAQHDIEMKQLRLDTAKQLLAMKEKELAEKERAAVEKVKETGKGVMKQIGDEAKTRNIVDSVTKKERQAITTLDEFVRTQLSQLGQAQSIMMQSMQERGEFLNDLMKALAAPKKRTAIRGPDGKIAEVLEELADGADVPDTVKALVSPRKRKAVRGADGKINGTIEGKA